MSKVNKFFIALPTKPIGDGIKHYLPNFIIPVQRKTKNFLKQIHFRVSI